jgi:hypothetical protein
MSFTITDFKDQPIFADAHFVRPRKRRKRFHGLAHIDRCYADLRIHRNAQALRLIEADYENAIFAEKRRTAYLNKISSDVRLMELESHKSGYDSSFASAIAELHQVYSVKEDRAEEHISAQLSEQADILRDAIFRAEERERIAQSLADQEREHIEHESECRLVREQKSAKAEYEQLQRELEKLQREQAESIRNKEKFLALKAERDESLAQRKPLPSPNPRIPLAPPKKPPRPVVY